MKYMLDLCAGFGGTSEAFMKDPGWQVTRVDNNPLLHEVENMEITDILEDSFDIGREGSWDYIHASPPCVDFSMGYNAPKMKAKRANNPYNPDLGLIKRCVEIIQWHKPKWWSIENVVGSIPDLKPVLGDPRFIAGPFVFWGNLPYPIFPANFKHHSKQNISGSKDPLRATKRAKIPLEISSALLSAISDQTFLEDWI